MDDGRNSKKFWKGARLVAITLIAAALIRSLLLATFVIPSQSMMPGLVTGDFFIASKWSYGWSRYAFSSKVHLFDGRLFGSMPEVGDVVIVAGVRDPGTTYVKRVMALPGDTFEMRAGRIVLNGRELPQRRLSDFVLPLGPDVICLSIAGLIDLRALTADGRPGCKFRRFVETLPNGRRHQVLDFAVAYTDTYGPVRIPHDRLMLVGDNRDDSLDSRVGLSKGGLGLVPVDRLLGKARTIVFSSDGTGSFVKPWTWQSSFRPERLGPVR